MTQKLLISIVLYAFVCATIILSFIYGHFLGRKNINRNEFLGYVVGKITGAICIGVFLYTTY